jgi:hypothetical protein
LLLELLVVDGDWEGHRVVALLFRSVEEPRKGLAVQVDQSEQRRVALADILDHIDVKAWILPSFLDLAHLQPKIAASSEPPYALTSITRPELMTSAASP